MGVERSKCANYIYSFAIITRTRLTLRNSWMEHTNDQGRARRENHYYIYVALYTWIVLHMYNQAQ